MINRQSPDTKGYTLIEILVSLTIISLIFTYGFVSFRDFSRRQALVSAKRSLTGELRLAQELALSGRKPSDPFCNTPEILNGYNFEVVSSTTFEIEAQCSGGSVLLKTVDMSEEITISTPTPNPILFKVLGHGTNIPSGNATITLTQAGTEYTQTITVSSSGEVK